MRACPHTAVDTCGFAAWKTLERARAYTDLFLFDLKLMDDRLHRQYTGVSNEPILRNLRKLSDKGHAIRLRLPIIPGVNDAPWQIRQIGEFAAGLPHLDGLDILPYHNIAAEKYRRLNRVYALPETLLPTEAQIAGIAQILRECGLQVAG